MSNPSRFHLVCEGPTDRIVIEAAIRSLLGGSDFILTQIQPETSLFAGNAGPYGGGWKGVRSWCYSMVAESGRLRDSSALVFTDLLIIHIDADVADENEVSCAKTCPPASDTTNALRIILLEWAGEVTLPPKVVLCTPSKNTEAWVVAALYPNDKVVSAAIECRANPEAILCAKPAAQKLVRRKGDRYKKLEDRYKEKAANFTKAWGAVRNICSEAERFSLEFQPYIPVAD
jgi:hypothetical protein